MREIPVQHSVKRNGEISHEQDYSIDWKPAEKWKYGAARGEL